MERADVQRILEDARAAVEGADVPNDLRTVAFEKAIDLLGGVGNASIGIAPVAPPAPQAPADAPPSAGTGADRTLDKVAERLKLSVDVVGDVFHIDNDNLAIGVGTSQLARRNSEAVKEVALLVAAGRQAGGWDTEWTPVSEIRSIADNYGKVDTNFATYVREMDDEFSFTGGSRSRKVKVKRKGFEDAAVLVKRLAGVE